MLLRNEDRELQIRLAELQADVQINLTICFGLIALFTAAIIGLEQIYFSLPTGNNVVKIYISIAVPLAGVVGLVFFAVFLKKAEDARKQMKELRNAEKL